MSRRERLEARAERRREWAAKREARASERFDAARRAVDGIPFGQPILVGHHSERRHRAALDRQDNAMRAACESSDMAKHHTSAAQDIEHQLARSIFSDDENAAEECERKAAELDESAALGVKINAAWRKHGPHAKAPDTAALRAALVALGLTDNQISDQVRTMGLCPWLKGPMFSGNVRANARRYRERAKAIRAESARKAEAAEAPGGVLLKLSGHEDAQACVTFPDYPGREVVADLKAAGFWWNRPSWYGPAAKLPERVREMLPADDVCPDGPACTDPGCMAEREQRAEGGAL